jgi:hypothetical protein
LKQLRHKKVLGSKRHAAGADTIVLIMKRGLRQVFHRTAPLFKAFRHQFAVFQSSGPDPQVSSISITSGDLTDVGQSNYPIMSFLVVTQPIADR